MVSNGYVFDHNGNKYVVTGRALNGMDHTVVYLCQVLKEGGQLVVWPESVVLGSSPQTVKEALSPMVAAGDRLVIAGSKKEAIEVEVATPQETSMLIQFLETDSCHEKLEILQHMRNHVTESELDSMSLSLDLDNETGSLEEKYYGLERFLKMRIRYEGRR